MKKNIFNVILIMTTMMILMPGCSKDEVLNTNGNTASTEEISKYEFNPMVTAFANDSLTLEEYLFLPNVTIKDCKVIFTNGSYIDSLTPVLAGGVREPDNVNAWEDLPRGVKPLEAKLFLKPLYFDKEVTVLSVEITYIVRQRTSLNNEWKQTENSKLISFCDTRSDNDNTLNIVSMEELPPQLYPITFIVSVEGWKTNEEELNM